MDFFFNFEKLKYVSTHSEDECIFCNLITKEPEAELLVTKSQNFSMILNLYPYNPGHTMIVPNRHITDIRHMSLPENREFDAFRDYCLDILTAIYQPHGFNIGFNMGRPAGASISHLHLHIIPRYPNEIGIAELLGGKRVLVENPVKTCKKMKTWIRNHPFST